MNEDTLYSVESGSPERVAAAIQKDCARLIALRTRGELGSALARIVLLYLLPRYPANDAELREHDPGCLPQVS